MKKYIASLLALVMCLSLCACCAGNDAANTLYNDIESTSTSVFMDNNEVETPTVTVETPTETTEPVIQRHPLLDKVYGEWELTSPEVANAHFSTFTILENGTCVADGVHGTWKIDTEYTNNTSLLLDLYNGESNKYMGTVCYYDGDDDLIRVSIDGWTFCPGYYVNKSNVITVELTPENWSEYFELVESVDYETDAFGDFSYADKTWSLQFKPQYAQVKQTVYTISIEFTLTTSAMNFKIDHDNKTIIISGESHDEENCTVKMNFTLMPGDSCGIYWSCVDENDNTINVLLDFQVLRIVGDTTIKLQELS